MEIPLNVNVECKDGVFGRSAYVLINPVIEQVTHLIVKEDESPNIEYMVPLEFVTKTEDNVIHLSCRKDVIKKMHQFIKTTVIEERVPESNFGSINGVSYYLPFVTSVVTEFETVENQQIPAGELALQRGTQVEATDGFVGKIDEFVVNRKSDKITHLVMREGHLWGKKQVIIPLSALGRTTADTVFLKLDKHQIETLPDFPLKRKWA
jgi:uncharacterized protein YifN (PemK superfamily)